MATIIVVLLASFAPLYHVRSDSDTLDVFVIDGQSNAAYANEPGSVDLTVVNSELGAPHHKLYYYGNTQRPTMYGQADTNYAIHPIYANGTYLVGGLVAPFAYYLSENQGRDILVLDVGVSGQSIANLVPGSVYGNWKMNILTAALGSISGYEHINLLGWAWLQGEADPTMAVSTYTAYFNDLEAYYASIGCPDCYIVKTREMYGGNATIAQANLIASNSHIHLGTDITDTFTGTAYMLDDVHYSQAARVIIAESVAEVVPIEHYGENGAADKLLAAIPVLIICALLLSIVTIFIRSRT